MKDTHDGDGTCAWTWRPEATGHDAIRLERPLEPSQRYPADATATTVI
jgi:hypothetical protein